MIAISTKMTKVTPSTSTTIARAKVILTCSVVKMTASWPRVTSRSLPNQPKVQIPLDKKISISLDLRVVGTMMLSNRLSGTLRTALMRAPALQWTGEMLVG